MHSRSLVHYAAAIGLTATAHLVRWRLDPWLGDAQALSLLFGAIAIAVWWGGLGPAVVAAVLGYLASDYLFIPPRGEFAIADATGVVALLTYTISCAVIIGFGEGLRRARRRAVGHAKEMERQKHALQRAERHKDEFLATLAHELRSPLATILNAVEALQMDRAAGHEVMHMGPVIERQVRHLVRLVDDLLDLSRISEGRLSLQEEKLDLSAVIASAIEIARPQLEAKRHELHVESPNGRLWVNGDYTRLVQVFSNLLLNAARYTPSRGHIVLAAREESGMAALSVADDGVGISPAVLPRIFDMFTQGEQDDPGSRHGLGIGLSLARRLLELHRGTIEARSAGIGKGSEFIVRLPIAASASDSESCPETGPPPGKQLMARLSPGPRLR